MKETEARRLENYGHKEPPSSVGDRDGDRGRDRGRWEGKEEESRERGQVYASRGCRGLSQPHLHMCNVYIDKLSKFVQGDYQNS